MKKCINPECGAELDDKAKFCFECGTKQPDETKCPQCGSKIDKNAKFCPECGAKLIANAPTGSKSSIGDNNAISAKDIVMGNNESFQGDKNVVHGDKIQAEHYVINQYTGAAPTEKTESEKEKDKLETARTKKIFRQESEAEIEAQRLKAKEFENKKDYYHAVQIYKKLAENNDLDAACNIFELEFQHKISLDDDEEDKLFTKIIQPNAKYGHPMAQALTGIYLADGDEDRKPNYAEAIKWLEMSTNSGNPWGAYCWALLYIDDNIDDTYKHSETGIETNNKFAVNLLVLSAKQNFEPAINLLATIYFYGIDGIPQNYNDTLFWAKEGDKLGLADCTYYLAWHYSNGVIVEKDDKKAFELYLKAAGNGNVGAQRVVANCYLNGVGTECNQYNAQSWFAKGAENGDIECMYQLGLCYYYEYAVNQDFAEALKWLKKAYDQNFIPAAYELGCIYREEYFEDKNESTATSYFKYGAENGNWSCQNMYGLALIYGRGIEKDVKTGIEWLEKVSEYDDWACCNLGYIYSQGEVVKKDIAKAKEYYMKVINKDPSLVDKSAKENAEEALKTLGVCTTNSDFTDKEGDSLLIKQANAAIREWDYNSAYAYCKKAMEYNDPAAVGKLDELYQFGCTEAENKHFKNAVDILTVFANNGSDDAKFTLAGIYLDGQNDGDINDSKNYAKGFFMIKQLAESGNAAAMSNVGWCYENGRGVKIDYKTALDWFQKAIDSGYEVDDWIKEHMDNCRSIVGDNYTPQKVNDSVKQAGEVESMSIRQANASIRDGYYDSAYKYCKKAQKEGDPAAEAKLKELYDLGCSEEAAKHFKNAVKIFQLFADDGNDEAKFELAFIFLDGENDGDKNDFKNYYYGFRVMKQLADAGNTSAMANVGWCYEIGRGVNTDYKAALNWFQKAIDSGYEVDDWIKDNMSDCKRNMSNSGDNVYSNDVIFHDLYVDQKDVKTKIVLHAHFVVSNNCKKKIIVRVTTKVHDTSLTYNKKETLEQIQYECVPDYEPTEWKDFQHHLTAKACSNLKVTSQDIMFTTTFEIIERHGNVIGSQSVNYKVKYDYHFFHDSNLFLIR